MFVCLSLSVCPSFSVRLFVCLSVRRFRLFVCLSIYLCLSVCPSVFVCLSVCLSVFVCLSVCPSVCLSLPVCLSIYLCLFVRLFLSVSLSVCLSLSVCPSFSVCLSVYLSLPVHLSVCLSLSVCLFVRLSICLCLLSIPKVLRGLRILRTFRGTLPTEQLVSLYNALVLPHLDYCSIIWGNCGLVLKNKLQVLQNRAARIITNSPYEVRSYKILNKLGWENLEMRRNKQKSTLMYNIVKGNAPISLKDLFVRSKELHEYDLRSSAVDLKLPLPHTVSKAQPFFRWSQIME